MQFQFVCTRNTVSTVFTGLWFSLCEFSFYFSTCVFCNAFVIVWSWMEASSIFAPYCLSTQWHTLLKPPTHPQPDLPLWNRERNASVIELLSFIFPPFARFPLIECVLSIRTGGGAGGEEEEEGGRDEEEATGVFCGTSRRDERGLSLFYSPCLSSFQPFEASHHTGLNSRRDTICFSTTTTSSLLGISPTHPSILPSLPPYLSWLCPLSTCDQRHPSTHSLAHNAAQWPLTGVQRKENRTQVQAELRTLKLPF